MHPYGPDRRNATGANPVGIGLQLPVGERSMSAGRSRMVSERGAADRRPTIMTQSGKFCFCTSVGSGSSVSGHGKDGKMRTTGPPLVRLPPG
jgi:hypothetical protein